MGGRTRGSEAGKEPVYKMTQDEATKQHRENVDSYLETLTKGIATLNKWVERDKASLEDEKTRYEQLDGILTKLGDTPVTFNDLRNVLSMNATLLSELRSNIRTQQYNAMLSERLLEGLRQALYMTFDVPYSMMEGMAPGFRKRLDDLADKMQGSKEVKVRVKKNIEKALQEWLKEKEELRKKAEEEQKRWKSYIG